MAITATQLQNEREGIVKLYEKGILNSLKEIYDEIPESKDETNWYFEAINFIKNFNPAKVNELVCDSKSAQMASLLDTEAFVYNLK